MTSIFGKDFRHGVKPLDKVVVFYTSAGSHSYTLTFFYLHYNGRFVIFIHYFRSYYPYYSMVEILSPCPSNWKLSPVESCRWIEKEMKKQFPLGVFKGAGTKQKQAGGA